MNLPYLIQVQLCIAIFWLIYRALMHNSGSFTHNRCYLLGAIAAAFIIPVLSIPVWPAAPAPVRGMAMIDIPELEMWMANVEPEELVQPVNWKAVALFLAGAGTLVMLSGVLTHVFRILRSTQRSRIVKSEYGRIVFNRKIKTPYSFFGYIFINEQEAHGRDLPQILAHELAHVRLGHSYDALLVQFMLVFFWWNPFVWLWSRSLKEIHEYQADAAVLNQGFDSKQYITLLIGTLADIHPEFVSGFSYSLIKNRLLMMTKQTGRTSKWRILAAVPALGATLLLFSFSEKTADDLFVQTVTDSSKTFADSIQVNEIRVMMDSADLPLKFTAAEMLATDDPNVYRLKDGTVQFQGKILKGEEITIHVDEKMVSAGGGATIITPDSEVGPQIQTPPPTGKTPEEDDEPFLTVENMPTFQGEGLTAFRAWVMSQLVYPQQAVQNKTEGRVTAQFVVEKDGSVSTVRIIESPDASLSSEVERIILSSPKWEPGTQRGRKVRLRFTLPVDFRLNNPDADTDQENPVSLAFRDGMGTVTGIKMNGEGSSAMMLSGRQNTKIFVNGSEFKGNFQNLNSNTIASVSVIKDDPDFPDGVIYATLKDGNEMKLSVDSTQRFSGSFVENQGETRRSIRISGNYNLQGEEKTDQPLIILDSIPQDADFDMDSLDPTNIQSISVLKNASATALYGPRGKNGVIIIELKKSSATE